MNRNVFRLIDAWDEHLKMGLLKSHPQACPGQPIPPDKEPEPVEPDEKEPQ